LLWLVLIPVKLPHRQPSSHPHTTGLPEHPNLLHNMVPVSGRVQFFGQKPVQFAAHLDDASGHRLDVAFPLFKETCVIEYQ
jgi:hypothetical protein